MVKIKRGTNIKVALFQAFSNGTAIFRGKSDYGNVTVNSTITLPYPSNLRMERADVNIIFPNDVQYISKIHDLNSEINSVMEQFNKTGGILIVYLAFNWTIKSSGVVSFRVAWNYYFDRYDGTC